MSETTTKAHTKQRQSTEELRAAMVDYARFLEECKRWGMGPNDMVLFYDPTKVTTKDLIRFHQRKIRTLQPKGQPIGRPKGYPKQKQSGRRSVSPEEALCAYAMDSDRTHWRDIAKTLWPSMKPADLRSDRTRLRVRYLIERGDRLTRQKTRELKPT